jgi:3-methyladenine DNA glycosylase AlkD
MVSRMATVTSVLKQLKALGSAKKRASAARVGVPMARAYGVPVGAVRALAKELKGQHGLAEPLWASGVHEARRLALFVADPKAMTRAQIERWLDDVVSWDLCDHLCGELVWMRSDMPALVTRWAAQSDLYVKRAAFAAIATAAVHDKAMTDAAIDDYLALIAAAADDARKHVKQAVSWALRSLGKRGCRERALAVAAELAESENAAARWVGRDALKELESRPAARTRARKAPGR